jgi:tetratricopeptide (TPR) repeat protein
MGTCCRLCLTTCILPGMLVLCSLFANGQHYTIADSNIVRNLQTQAYDSVLTNPKASLALAEKELKMAQEIDYKPDIGSAEVSIGFAYFHMGDIKNALKWEEEGLEYARQHNYDRVAAGALNRLAVLYTAIGALDKTFECSAEELKLHLKDHDSVYAADSYTNMAIALHKQELFDEAITNYLKAQELYHRLKAPYYESIVLSSIADIYMLKKQFPEALVYLSRALSVDKNATAYSFFGDYYVHTGKNDDSALYYYGIAYKKFAADSDRLDMARMEGAIGQIETRQGNYGPAEEHLKQALALAIHEADIEEIGKRENGLADLYVKRNDFKSAYEHHLAATTAKDSFSKTTMTAKLAELGKRFDVKEMEEKNKSLQKENDLQKLKLQKKNILISGAVAAFVAFLVIGLLLFRQNKLHANQQKTELEQKQLRAQMNPHFIFNCLNSIQHFVVINDVKNANKYLTGFASLMRQTLENSKEGTITLGKELAYLDNYLALELMRFKDKFTAEIICVEDIDPNAVKIPAMIIQPFIENAIRHGLCYLKDKSGKLVIKFYIRDSNLFCEIDDNGIGRLQSQKLKEHANIVYESQGMELTKQRLALVSKSSGSDYTIAIVDKIAAQNESEGTTIIIKFPLEA